MAKKITYLLGAGASANAIPVVVFMQQRIVEIIEFLKSCLPVNPLIVITPVKVQADKVPLLTDIISNFEWLVKEAGNYYTVDTLAKKYYLTDDRISLQRLKKSLITYFTIEQQLNIKSKKKEEIGYTFTKESIDKRYNSFIAAISKKKYPIAISGVISDGLDVNNLSFELNKNIKILSWNYDVQFELSLSYFTNTIIEHIKTNFKILPNNNSKNEVNATSIDLGSFGMVKLNGDAILHKLFQKSYDKYTLITTKNNPEEKELLNIFLKEFETCDINSEKDLPNDRNKSPIMGFNFAWENDNNVNDKYIGHSKNLEAAREIASETEILVVIGYSFPIFNREIDDTLFKRMKKLKKVYIQDRQPEKIKSTMQNAFEILQTKTVIDTIGDYEMTGDQSVDFHLDNSVDQFIIPFELNQ